jgi:hypothetical protein
LPLIAVREKVQARRRSLLLAAGDQEDQQSVCATDLSRLHCQLLLVACCSQEAGGKAAHVRARFQPLFFGSRGFHHENMFMRESERPVLHRNSNATNVIVHREAYLDRMLSSVWPPRLAPPASVAMIQALRAVVHDSATPDQAYRLFKQVRGN